MSRFLAKHKKAVKFHFKLCADFYWTPFTFMKAHGECGIKLTGELFE